MKMKTCNLCGATLVTNYNNDHPCSCQSKRLHRWKRDPVFLDRRDNKFYFYDGEEGLNGPYDTVELADKALSEWE